MRRIGGPGIVVGLDEVGRGALAGPLTVAAVVLPDEPQIVGIDDSKKLSPRRREELAILIREHAIGIGIAHIPAPDIDARGMSSCLRQAMVSALDEAQDSCGCEADAVLVDGIPLGIHPKEISVVKGDAKIACISAASIVAKVTRDALMIKMGERYPTYALETNKGYGSPVHIANLKKQGPCELHRRTFLNNILNGQQELL